METVSVPPGGVLVIGAGIAGLWTALSLHPRPVTIITAGKVGDGSSSWAQGGMAAAIGSDDSPALHARDTLTAGAGLAQPEAVAFLCNKGPAAVQQLSQAGVPFDRTSSGEFRLGREAAHGKDRIIHVGGDEAGAAIMRTLTGLARRSDHIEIREETVAERLITVDGKVAGAKIWDVRRQASAFLSAATVVLATGGIGGLYAVTTNPLSSQGHGLTMAAEAGAVLRDLEFVQFHPTALDVGRDPAPLATEAIRGEGGLLRDQSGERFMTKLHPNAELAPRDVVARGVAQAIRATGGAFLDVRGPLGGAFGSRFPTVAEACREANLDPETDLLPVAPAVHYHMGGVRTDLSGETDVPNLFAVGECASTGVHGANRLASNSLLEAIVFGTAAAEAIGARDVVALAAPASEETDLAHRPARSLDSLRRRMADAAGIIREASQLKQAIDAMTTDGAATEGGRLARSAAGLILQSALFREESRGAHQRTDFPETAANARHTLLRFDSGKLQLTTEDIPS